MTLGKNLLARTIYGVALFAVLGACSLAEANDRCQPPKTGTNDVPIFSPPVSQIIKGKGKVQFYSAPNAHCPMKGVFAAPKDEVLTSAQTSDGWSSVTYNDPKTGTNVSGWVQTGRLKEPAKGGPKL